jgi:pimeloyl-ACP methyl ester carboxylesterase
MKTMTTDSPPAATYKVRPRKPSADSFRPPIKEAKGSFVLLHGWDSIGCDMDLLRVSLQKLPDARGWNFYTPTYETHLKTFTQAAQDLFRYIDALTQPLILLGYSEGAIVARRMILDGLQVQALITICGPHLGTGRWIPPIDVGLASISPFSPDLKKLNDSKVEASHRKSYHLFAITCTDAWPLPGTYHDDDGVVLRPSALGLGLGSVAERTAIHLDYNGYIAGGDPHHRGMDPAYLKPLIDTCDKLLATSVVAEMAK